MEIDIWITLIRVSTGINILLLLGLSYIWAQNYREIGSRITLGFLIFGLIMLGENSVAMYYYIFHEIFPTWYVGQPDVAKIPLAVLRVLSTFAFLFLARITLE
ncbi:MAG: hypothetical protein U5J64_05800 [Halobacteriales archaeon]|nr:hypothetical protein [Halobacteriales archaeon]